MDHPVFNPPASSWANQSYGRGGTLPINLRQSVASCGVPDESSNAADVDICRARCPHGIYRLNQQLFRGEVTIERAAGGQLVVRALIYYAAGLKRHDPVGILDRREAMSDNDRRLAL